MMEREVGLCQPCEIAVCVFTYTYIQYCTVCIYRGCVCLLMLYIWLFEVCVYTCCLQNEPNAENFSEEIYCQIQSVEHHCC